MSLGRSLELFFIDGRPDGMLTAEVFNWTGHVLRIPRTQIKQGLDRAETNQTGVYVLLGQTENGPLAYVGESEDLRKRLRDHVSGKDWWDTAVLITTTGDMLHKAHVKYLESRLVEIARSVGNTPLENSTTPPRSSLSEAGTANMESFLDTLGMVFPAIRIDMFLEKIRNDSVPALQAPNVQTGVEFELRTPKHGLHAKATLLGGELIVKAGSTARSAWMGATDAKTHYFKLFDDLINSGVLVADQHNRIFARDYAFTSPSAAAAIVNGRSSKGPRVWKHVETGLTFADWEAQQLASEEPQE